MAERLRLHQPALHLLLQGSGPDRRLEIGDTGAFNDRFPLQVVGNNAIYQAASDILRWIPQDKEPMARPLIAEPDQPFLPNVACPRSRE
jgi:hypothetical protein